MGSGEVSHPSVTLQGIQIPLPLLTRPYCYLCSISYYGARFKGWAVQPGQPTVQGKLERVLAYVLGHSDFSILGSSRTDSGVSCRSGFVQIFLPEKVDLGPLLPQFNLGLGGEIKLTAVREVARDFNLIQAVEKKTYHYYFSDSPVYGPFDSSFITEVHRINTLDQMKENALLFIGEHDFRAFCRVSENKQGFVREILEAGVFELDKAEFGPVPDKSYGFEVTGTGFLHHQVRKMVHAIWYFTPGQILERLRNPQGNWDPIPTASSNGLMLWKTFLKDL